MAKASKWLINLLLGRKDEEKNKKKIINDFHEENQNVKNKNKNKKALNVVTRRLSFGRSSSKVGKFHKEGFPKSFESSIRANPVVENGPMVDFGDMKKEVLARDDGLSRAIRDAAATRIQAVFRSYLAKKALCALRALVKLQALARGHLMRKKTTAVFKQMHALMAIQVRARFQRTQMAEKPQLVGRSHSSRHRKIFRDYGPRARSHREEAIDTAHYYYEHNGVPKRIEHGITIYFQGRNHLSMSRPNHQHLKEYFVSPPHNTPQLYYPSMTKTTVPRRRASFSYELPKSYMAKTESSKAKAKARSRSEPKQRPNGSVSK